MERKANMMQRDKRATDVYPRIGSVEFGQWVMGHSLIAESLDCREEKIRAYQGLDMLLAKMLSDDGGVNDMDIAECERCGWVGDREDGCRCWEMDA